MVDEPLKVWTLLPNPSLSVYPKLPIGSLATKYTSLALSYSTKAYMPFTYTYKNTHKCIDQLTIICINNNNHNIYVFSNLNMVERSTECFLNTGSSATRIFSKVYRNTKNQVDFIVSIYGME